CDTVQGLADGDERPAFGRVLDGPAFAAVAAAGQQMFLRSVVIDRVPGGAVVLEIAGAEPHEDLIAPGPQPVVGWPAAEPAALGVDLHVPEDRRLLFRRRGE